MASSTSQMAAMCSPAIAERLSHPRPPAPMTPIRSFSPGPKRRVFRALRLPTQPPPAANAASPADFCKNFRRVREEEFTIERSRNGPRLLADLAQLGDPAGVDPFGHVDVSGLVEA